MQLIVNGDAVYDDPDDTFIEQTLRTLDMVEEEFAILSTDDELTYIQTRVMSETPGSDKMFILLEYQDQSLDQHYLCVSDVDIEQVIRAFGFYLRCDQRWRTELEWEHYPL